MTFGAERSRIRSEIEGIIKEKKIDRESFYEYSKTKYQYIINQFYYSFVDYEKYPYDGLGYCWLHFREELYQTGFVSEGIGWRSMLEEIKIRLSYDWNKKVYFILSHGWVYEGYLDSIIDVLDETDGLLKDFYIVTPQFDKFAAYCEDDERLIFYEK